MNTTRTLPAYHQDEHAAAAELCRRSWGSVRGRPNYLNPDHAAIADYFDNVRWEGTRERLAGYLDDAQLQAYIDGTPFQIGDLAVSSCLFGSGNLVHLRYDAASARRLGHALDKDGAHGAKPVCGQRGGRLYDFDEYAFEAFTETFVQFGSRFELSEALSLDDVLRSLCRECMMQALITSQAPGF